MGETLASLTRDLTDAAHKGLLDPVIGREEEIRRTLQVLSRRTKNNPGGWGGVVCYLFVVSDFILLIASAHCFLSSASLLK